MTIQWVPDAWLSFCQKGPGVKIRIHFNYEMPPNPKKLSDLSLFFKDLFFMVSVSFPNPNSASINS